LRLAALPEPKFSPDYIVHSVGKFAVWLDFVNLEFSVKHDRSICYFEQFRLWPLLSIYLHTAMAAKGTVNVEI
jgi:hypothetical protein